ncbi:MAG: tetratricopeptide repeat protein [Fimbriimonadaceae bacterium]|nr:tetratricopeptide repeat protein [Fimbriimonadaceae bacterium]
MLQSYNWRQAKEACLETLAKDPDHLGALETIAQAQWFGGEFDAVIATMTRLLRLNPHEPGYRYTRGMARLSQGDLTHAAEDFRRALAQSNIAAFREQVASSLDAVELWMEDLACGRPVRHKGTWVPAMGIRSTQPRNDVLH